MQTLKDKVLKQLNVIKPCFPFLAWLPELKQKNILIADIIAGFTVALLMIPQSMAYAHLAGLPVNYGLYAAFIPPIVGALFGSSRILSTAPVPISSLLTIVALQPLVAVGTPNYIQYVLLLTFFAGIIQCILGILRFGIVVNFISFPVILGFINAVAIIIASLQLSNLFGVYAVHAPNYFQTVWQVMGDAINDVHWPSVGMAAITFLIILGGRRVWPQLPHTIIAVIITTLIAWLTHYEKLETINPNQIINPAVQAMVKHFQTYESDMEKLLADYKKSEHNLKDTTERLGRSSELTEKALAEETLAKWQLQRYVIRHNIASDNLNRLQLKRLITKDNKVYYYVDDEMTPIGKSDPLEWRIAKLSPDGSLVLRAGGEVIGNITPGLPTLRPISFSWEVLSQIFTIALVIALVGFTEAITIANRVATEMRQRINVNQELLGQGLAKMAGSLFQSMPVSGGFTRTALNFYAGARTGFSSVVAGLVVMIVLLFFTPLFYYLPYATLAAVIMVSVLGLLDIKEIIRVWKISRNEGIVAVVTFVLTLLLAPRLAQAVLLAIVLSLGFYLYETMRPRFTELIRNPDGDLIEITNPKEQKTVNLISLIRFNGSLYFANCAYFEEKILNLISSKKKLQYIILDCVSVNKIDASGLETLRSIVTTLREAGIELYFTRVRPPILDKLKKGGLYEKIEHHIFKNNNEALENLAINIGRQAFALMSTEKPRK